MKSIATACCVGALVASFGATAHAETNPFDPQFEQTVAEVPWSSSWIPSATAPVRLQLQAVARQDVRIDMSGDANFDSSTEELGFRGVPDGGTIHNRLEVDVTAVLHVSFLGSNTQSDVGTWTIEREVEADFTPYLLLGNTDAPVILSDDVAGATLADVPIEVGPATGRLVIDWRLAATEISFSGTRIDLYPEDSDEVLVSATTEHESVDLELGLEPGESISMEGIEVGRLGSRIALILEPRLDVTLGDLPVSIAPTELSLDLPVLDAETIEFDPVEMTWTAPEDPVEGTTGGVDPDEGDGSGSSGSTTTTSGDGSTSADSTGSSTDASSSSGSPMAGGVSEDGCGCTSSPRGSTPWALAVLLLMGVGTAMRRRS